jgi:hypothetical protein
MYGHKVGKPSMRYGQKVFKPSMFYGNKVSAATKSPNRFSYEEKEKVYKSHLEK